MQIYLLSLHAVLPNCYSLRTECRECFGFSVRTRRYFAADLCNKTIWNILQSVIPHNIFSLPN